MSCRELRARLGRLLMIRWRATAHVFLPVLEEGPRAGGTRTPPALLPPSLRGSQVLQEAWGALPREGGAERPCSVGGRCLSASEQRQSPSFAWFPACSCLSRGPSGSSRSPDAHPSWSWASHTFPPVLACLFPLMLVSFVSQSSEVERCSSCLCRLS